MVNSLFNERFLKVAILSRKKLSGEHGFTLMEIVVMIILLGVTVPSIFALYSQLSVISTKSKIFDQMSAYGEQKMEQVLAIKDKQWNWYKKLNQFTEDVDLPDSYHRTVTVKTIHNWGNAGLTAWEIVVNVTHPRVASPYSLVVRLTKYHE